MSKTAFLSSHARCVAACIAVYLCCMGCWCCVNARFRCQTQPFLSPRARQCDAMCCSVLDIVFSYMVCKVGL